jgi:uncharacterized spore protein YtfJ
MVRLEEEAMNEVQAPSVLDRFGTVKDAMTVGRAFGDSYQVEGITIIPVAAVRGGGGGGSGTGTTSGSDNGGLSGGKETGSGMGLGFGAAVRPIGVVVVKDGTVTWQPTIDVMRIVLGAQLLGLAAILAFRRRALRR